MKIRKRLAAGAVAATTSIGVALSGAALITPAQADERPRAALAETPYGYESTAYGSRVTAENPGLDSTRSAFSYLACTRLAGRSADETLASVSLPAAGDPYIQVDGIASKNRTFRAKNRNIAGGITGTNRIAKVSLGGGEMPLLTIDTLRTRSRAWATLSGKLRTRNNVSSGGITLEGITDPGDDSPLGDLFDAVNGGINEVLAALQQNGGKIEIPGLGLLSFGFDRQVTFKRFAAASSFVLRVNVYGPDGVAGGDDDALVGIGRSWARINRDLPSGIMGGVGYGANAQFLDGVVKVGKLGAQPMPCNGTQGEIREEYTAGISLPTAGDPQLSTGEVGGRSFGKKLKRGAARAWTEGSVANLKLDTLELRGIVGKANVKQNRAGKVVRRNIRGSSIGEVIVDGESQGSIDPATAEPIVIPGVAEVRFFVKRKTNRGMRVSAVVVKLLDDTPGLSKIRLGNAAVFIKRY